MNRDQPPPDPPEEKKHGPHPTSKLEKNDSEESLKLFSKPIDLALTSKPKDSITEREAKKRRVAEERKERKEMKKKARGAPSEDARRNTSKERMEAAEKRIAQERKEMEEQRKKAASTVESEIPKERTEAEEEEEKARFKNMIHERIDREKKERKEKEAMEKGDAEKVAASKVETERKLEAAKRIMKKHKLEEEEKRKLLRPPSTSDSEEDPEPVAEPSGSPKSPIPDNLFPPAPPRLWKKTPSVETPSRVPTPLGMIVTLGESESETEDIPPGPSYEEISARVVKVKKREENTFSDDEEPTPPQPPAVIPAPSAPSAPKEVVPEVVKTSASRRKQAVPGKSKYVTLAARPQLPPQNQESTVPVTPAPPKEPVQKKRAAPSDFESQTSEPKIAAPKKPAVKDTTTSIPPVPKPTGPSVAELKSSCPASPLIVHPVTQKLIVKQATTTISQAPKPALPAIAAPKVASPIQQVPVSKAIVKKPDPQSSAVPELKGSTPGSAPKVHHVLTQKFVVKQKPSTSSAVPKFATPAVAAPKVVPKLQQAPAQLVPTKIGPAQKIGPTAAVQPPKIIIPSIPPAKVVPIIRFATQSSPASMPIILKPVIQKPAAPRPVVKQVVKPVLTTRPIPVQTKPTPVTMSIASHLKGAPTSQPVLKQPIHQNPKPVLTTVPSASGNVFRLAQPAPISQSAVKQPSNAPKQAPKPVAHPVIQPAVVPVPQPLPEPKPVKHVFTPWPEIAEKWSLFEKCQYSADDSTPSSEERSAASQCILKRDFKQLAIVVRRIESPQERWLLRKALLTRYSTFTFNDDDRHDLHIAIENLVKDGVHVFRTADGTVRAKTFKNVPDPNDELLKKEHAERMDILKAWKPNLDFEPEEPIVVVENAPVQSTEQNEEPASIENEKSVEPDETPAPEETPAPKETAEPEKTPVEPIDDSVAPLLMKLTDFADTIVPPPPPAKKKMKRKELEDTLEEFVREDAVPICNKYEDIFRCVIGNVNADKMAGFHLVPTPLMRRTSGVPESRTNPMLEQMVQLKKYHENEMPLETTIGEVVAKIKEQDKALREENSPQKPKRNRSKKPAKVPPKPLEVSPPDEPSTASSALKSSPILARLLADEPEPQRENPTEKIVSLPPQPPAPFPSEPKTLGVYPQYKVEGGKVVRVPRPKKPSTRKPKYVPYATPVQNQCSVREFIKSTITNVQYFGPQPKEKIQGAEKKGVEDTQVIEDAAQPDPIKTVKALRKSHDFSRIDLLLQDEPKGIVPTEPVKEISADPVNQVPADPVPEIRMESPDEVLPEPVHEIPAAPVKEVSVEPMDEILTEPLNEVPPEPVNEIRMDSPQMENRQSPEPMDTAPRSSTPEKERTPEHFAEEQNLEAMNNEDDRNDFEPNLINDEPEENREVSLPNIDMEIAETEAKENFFKTRMEQFEDDSFDYQALDDIQEKDVPDVEIDFSAAKPIAIPLEPDSDSDAENPDLRNLFGDSDEEDEEEEEEEDKRVEIEVEEENENENENGDEEEKIRVEEVFQGYENYYDGGEIEVAAEEEVIEERPASGASYWADHADYEGPEEYRKINETRERAELIDLNMIRPASRRISELGDSRSSTPVSDRYSDMSDAEDHFVHEEVTMDTSRITRSQLKRTKKQAKLSDSDEDSIDARLARGIDKWEKRKKAEQEEERRAKKRAHLETPPKINKPKENNANQQALPGTSNSPVSGYDSEIETDSNCSLYFSQHEEPVMTTYEKQCEELEAIKEWKRKQKVVKPPPERMIDFKDRVIFRYFETQRRAREYKKGDSGDEGVDPPLPIDDDEEEDTKKKRQTKKKGETNVRQQRTKQPPKTQKQKDLERAQKQEREAKIGVKLYLTEMSKDEKVAERQCDKCFAVLVSTEKLKRHEKTHKDEIDANCIICGAPMKFSYNLSTHLKKCAQKLTMPCGLDELREHYPRFVAELEQCRKDNISELPDLPADFKEDDMGFIVGKDDFISFTYTAYEFTRDYPITVIDDKSKKNNKKYKDEEEEEGFSDEEEDESGNNSSDPDYE